MPVASIILYYFYLRSEIQSFEIGCDKRHKNKCLSLNSNSTTTRSTTKSHEGGKKVQEDVKRQESLASSVGKESTTGVIAAADGTSGGADKHSGAGSRNTLSSVHVS